MAKVYFATTEVTSLTRTVTLPAKFGRMIDRFRFKKRFQGKTVAIKMHLGEGLGYSTIHPLFVRILTDKIREAGGKPFITDGSHSVWDVAKRGYTEETLGAKILPAAGATGKYFRTVQVEYTRGKAELKELQLCGNVVDADALVVLSHFKGHGEASYGGAIKNLAMGCVTRASRAALHRLEIGGFTWDKNKCIHCGRCVENCPTGACTQSGGEISIFLHHCVYCRHCAKSCPVGAIDVDSSGQRKLQDGLAIAAREVVRCIPRGCVVCFNVALNITPLCDCWGMTTQSIVPDVGIFGSVSVPAVDKAALDHVKVENFIPGSLPAGRKLGRSGHLFQRVWGTNPYYQLQAAEEFGLGKADYKLEYVE